MMRRNEEEKMHMRHMRQAFEEEKMHMRQAFEKENQMMRRAFEEEQKSRSMMQEQLQ